jgi:putative DNA primase/helicase
VDRKPVFIISFDPIVPRPPLCHNENPQFNQVSASLQNPAPEMPAETEFDDDTLRIAALSAIPTEIRDTTEDKLSTDFAHSVRSLVRHSGQWARWLYWTGTQWQFDYSVRSWNYCREFLRIVFDHVVSGLYNAECGKMDVGMSRNQREEFRNKARAKAQSQAKALLSMRTIHNVTTLTKSDPTIATEIEQWDADPWLLNTPDGTVDLRTGDMRPHNPLDYITKSTAVGPVLGQPKLWLAFLRTIMRGDEEMVRYLQKVFGYCLVGETKEHQMYFGYGTGANGKGVTLNTIRDLLGDYGVEASIETFVINSISRHPTELADLRGARLVTCGETDEGQRWAEARIKMLTGGDPVKARFMRQDFFQYTPQFKLFLAGNHRPKLTNVDEAIERRFRLIPFTYTVPREQRDVDLGKKLREEGGQILSWCIEGCMMWQREGLNPPESVASATKTYLSQEDALTAWQTESLVFDNKGFEYAKDLFDSWQTWAIANGEPVGTKRKLTLAIEDRESIWKAIRGNRQEGVGFRGLRLLTDADKPTTTPQEI